MFSPWKFSQFGKERAVRNAREAATSLSRARVEREEVEAHRGGDEVATARAVRAAIRREHGVPGVEEHTGEPECTSMRIRDAVQHHDAVADAACPEEGAAQHRPVRSHDRNIRQMRSGTPRHPQRRLAQRPSRRNPKDGQAEQHNHCDPFQSLSGSQAVVPHENSVSP